MILNTKELITTTPTTQKKFVYVPGGEGGTVTVPAPPNTALKDLLSQNEVLVVYPWQDHGAVGDDGEVDPLQWHSGVEILAFAGDYADFEYAWDNARGDWLSHVYSMIQSEAEQGADPTEVYEFGLTPVEFDFILHGAAERRDWGIRRLQYDWQKVQTRPLVETNTVIGLWHANDFPVGEPVYDEDTEEI